MLALNVRARELKEMVGEETEREWETYGNHPRLLYRMLEIKLGRFMSYEGRFVLTGMN